MLIIHINLPLTVISIRGGERCRKTTEVTFKETPLGTLSSSDKVFNGVPVLKH